jgi:hypothetical protein
VTVTFVPLDDITLANLAALSVAVSEPEPDPAPAVDKPARQRAEVEALLLAAIMARSPSARLLHLVAGAFQVHGFGRVCVGLFHADTFPEHHGGVGVGVGVPSSQCQAAEWLLEAMGVENVHEDGVGVVGTLRGELGPCPDPASMPGGLLPPAEPVKLTRTCPWCGARFTVRWPKGNKQRFCTRAHRLESYAARGTRKHERVEGQFEDTPGA